MRKNFLILMLLSLLPLAGWADDYVVTLTTVTKTYGEATPEHVPLSGFTITPYNATVKAALENHISLVRVGSTSEDAGTNYEFEGEFDGTNTGDLAGHTIQMGPANGKLKINKFDFSQTYADNVTLTVPNQYHTGSALKPAGGDVVIKISDAATNFPVFAASHADNIVAQTSEYTIKADGYGENVSTTGSLTIEGTGNNFTGTKVLNFTILGINIANYEFSYNSNATAYVFDNTDKEPTEDVFTAKLKTDPTQTLAHNSKANWKITGYAANKAAGTATVTITGQGTYAGTATATFQIAPKTDVSNLTINITDPQYTGNAATPTVSIVDRGTTPNYTLVAGTDYTATSSDVNAGAATLNITFKGSYNGATAQTKSFTILQNAFPTAANLIMVDKEEGRDDDNYYYNNTDIKPAVTIKASDAADAPTLTAGTDYTIEWVKSDNTADVKSLGAKKIVITPTGTGNYTNNGGTAIEKTYTVIARPLTLTLGDVTVGKGADIKPETTFSNYASEEGLDDIKGENFDITYKYYLKSTDTEKTYSELTPGTEYEVAAVVTNLSPNYSLADADNHRANLTITKTQVVLKVADVDNYTYGSDLTNFTLEYESGLAAGDVDTYMTTINGSLTQTDFKYNGSTITSAIAKTLHTSETGYEITYAGDLSDANYTVSVKPGKLYVVPKTIEAVNGTSTFQVAIAEFDYEGKATTDKTVTITDNSVAVDPSNFEVAYDESFEQGTRTATFTVANNSNYAISIDHDNDNSTPNVDYFTVQYTINKKTLTIVAADRTLPYGFTADQLNDFTVAANKPTVTGLVGREKDYDLTSAANGTSFGGVLKVKNIKPNTVGGHENALEPYFVNATTGEEITDINTVNTNYTITITNDNRGNLTISPAEIALQVKDKTVTYGETITTFELEPTAESNFPASELANFNSIVNYENAAAKFSYNAETMKAANTEGYDISYNGTAPTSTNYTINETVATGKLIVNRRPVSIKVKAGIDDVAYANLATFKTNLATNAGGAYVELDGTTTAYGDEITDLVTIELVTSKVGEANQIHLAAKAGVEDNYILNLTDGTVNITSDGVVDKTFYRVSRDNFASATAAGMINDLDGETINFILKYNDDESFNTFKNEQWYAMVLPFDTDVKEISKQFGYAVVNLLNYDNTDTGKYYFKLHMGDVPANTPFMVKAYNKGVAGIDMNTTGVTFNSIEIVNPVADPDAEAGDVTVDADGNPYVFDKAGNMFVGTYVGKNAWSDNDLTNARVYSLTTGGQGNVANGTTPSYVRQFSRYFLINPNTPDPEAVEFILEEIDGTTTVIKAIDSIVDATSLEGWYSLSGVKLQGAPTEKGVYIKDGKKVVIK